MTVIDNFYSDNCSGIHPQILEAITNANTGYVASYGNDFYTKSAISKLKEHFGDSIEVYFALNGTSANVLSIKALTQSYNSVICAETAHLNGAECGALENFAGCKIVALPTKDGKLTVDSIKDHLTGFGDKHRSQPKVISISQPTELGTVYSIEEIQSIARIAHENGLLLHMDGARLFNAAAYLDVTLKSMTTDVGVDVLSFGGTKNGLMIGEAVLFLKEDLGLDFQYIQKQGFQLASKMRFIAAQFEALLSNNLWLQNARHANEMANLLAIKVQEFPSIKVTQKVEANMVFVNVPHDCIQLLLKKYSFIKKEGKEESFIVRWVTSFNTTEEDIDTFVKEIEKSYKTCTISS